MPKKECSMSSYKPFLSRRFNLALDFAAGLHQNQCRKGTNIPYIAHLMGVCATVLENGGHEDPPITADLRNARKGQSIGPVEVDRPWDSYADDQLGLMDHPGIDKFMVMGFCIGGPFIWSLLKRAPNRVVAAVLAQPSGFRPEMPDLFYQNNISG